MFYAIVCFLISIFSPVFSLRIIGRENIPREGGVIIASNHMSYLDIPLLGYSMFTTGRRADFMAKKELFSIPVLGFLLRMLGGFPIDRAKYDRVALREAVKRLKAGNMVVIYPEGTRSIDGRLQSGKSGVGLIVKMSSKKVIPVGIKGTDKALPVGKWLPKPYPVTITFGEPLDFSNMMEKNDEKSNAEEITDTIMGNIAALIANRQGDMP